MNTKMKQLAEQFSIPMIENDRNIWFVRTKGGLYYKDFLENQFVALGWDLVHRDVVLSSEITKEQKLEKIKETYPEHKKHSLILGQMDTFFNKMQKRDIVLIPSRSTTEISIGILGDIIDDIDRRDVDSRYSLCKYRHKRKVVRWLGNISVSNDIYLYRQLAAHQTITNVNSMAALLYRNIYPLYIEEDTIHFTLKRTDFSEYGFAKSVRLQNAILDIICEFAKSNKISNNVWESIVAKTAVGSPGFLECIIHIGDDPVFLMIFVMWILASLAGKEKKSPDGTIERSGMIGIIHALKDWQVVSHHLKLSTNKTTDNHILTEDKQSVTMSSEDKIIIPQNIDSLLEIYQKALKENQMFCDNNFFE